MIWFTWRQFRTQTWITVGALAALGVVLVISGRSIADAFAAANVAACQGDCTSAIDNFLSQVRNSTSGTVYDLATGIMYLLPAVIGVFWGAPMIARELETGTHRLAWNQSVTRTRWLATKLAIVGRAAAATVGLLSWAVTSWAHRIDDASGDRITPLVYGARGIVPVGYALFAFVLGVTAGMLIRRTVPAMAATLAIYIAAVYSMGEWIRAHLRPASHVTNPLDVSSLNALMISPGNEMTVVASENVPDAWILSNQTITQAGEVFSGPADLQTCGIDAPAQVCEEWLGTLGLRQRAHLPPRQPLLAPAVDRNRHLLAIAVLLAGFCFWWTRRRLT
jgi:hypothetical protein